MLDRASLGVVVVYVCQLEGRPSVKEIVEVIHTKIDADVKKKDIKNAVLSAQKKGLLSVNKDSDNEKRYSVTNVQFAKPPEIAQLKTLLPSFLETPEAKALAQKFEGLETNDKEHKKPRLPDIRDYKTIEAQMELVTPMLGGNPDSDEVLRFRKLGDKVWLPLNLWIQAALGLRLRQLNITESKTKYMDIKDVFLNKKVIAKDLTTLFVTVQGMGGSWCKLEAIPEGTSFPITVSFPTTSGLSVNQMLWCLDGIRIGSKHKEYGLLRVKSHQVTENSLM